MNNIVGHNIRLRRKELKLSQTDLAKLLGYASKSAISSVECGKEQISTDRVRQFAEVLECSPSYLMGWEGDEILEAYRKAPEKTKKAVRLLLEIDRPD